MVEMCDKEALEEHNIQEPHLSCSELQEDNSKADCDISEGLINSQNAAQKCYEPPDDPQDDLRGEPADNHPPSASEYYSQNHTLERSCSFVDDSLPDEYKCPICREVLDQPTLVSCCGLHYCKGCIEQAQEKKYKKYTGNTCPVCRGEFTVLLDKGVQRKIFNLKVTCKHQGCQWKGKYQNHPAHVNNGCPMKRPATAFVASTADTGKDLQIQLRYTPLTTLDELVLAKELKKGLCLLPPALVTMLPLPPKMHLDMLMTPHFKVALVECAAALTTSVESSQTQQHISPPLPPQLGEFCHHSMLPVQSIASNLGQCTAVQSLNILAMHACFTIVASGQRQLAKFTTISLGSNGLTGNVFLSGQCRAICMEAFASVQSHLPTYVKECLAQLVQPTNTFVTCVQAYTQLQLPIPTSSSSSCVPYTRIVAPSHDRYTATRIVAPSQDRYAATCIVAPSQDQYAAMCIVAPSQDRCTATCIVAPSQDRCAATCIVAPSQDRCAAMCIVAPSQDRCAAMCIVAPSQDRCAAMCIVAPSQDWCTATCIVAPSQDRCTAISVSIVTIRACVTIIAPSQGQLKVQAMHACITVAVSSHGWRYTAITVKVQAMHACITVAVSSHGWRYTAITVKVQAMHACIAVTVSSHGWRYTAITVKVLHAHLMIVHVEHAKDTAAFLSSQLQSHMPTSSSRSCVPYARTCIIAFMFTSPSNAFATQFHTHLQWHKLISSVSSSKSCIPYTRRATVSSIETCHLIHATEAESMIYIREVMYQSIQQVGATGLKYWSYFRFVQCYESRLTGGQLRTEVTQNLFVAYHVILGESYTLFFAPTAFYTVQFGRKVVSKRYTCFDESKSSPCGNNQPTRQSMMRSQSPLGYKQTLANSASKHGLSFSYHPNLLHCLMACSDHGASLTNSALFSLTEIDIQTLPQIEGLSSGVAQKSLHFESIRELSAFPESVPHKCKQQQKVSDVHANWPDNSPKLPQFSKSSSLSSQARARHLTLQSLKHVKHQITGHPPKPAQSKTVPTSSRHTGSRQPPISTYQPAYKYKHVNKKKHNSFSLPHSSSEPVYIIPRTKDHRVKRGKVSRKITRRTFKTTTYTHIPDNVPNTTLNYEPLKPHVTLVKNPPVLSCPIGQGSPSNSKSSSKDGEEGSHQQSASPRRSPSCQRSTSSSSGSGGSDDEDDGEKRTPKRQCEDDNGHCEERNTKEEDDEKGTPKRQCEDDNGHYEEQNTEASEDEKRTPKRQCEDDKGHYEEQNTKASEDEKGTPKRRCEDDIGHYEERNTETSEDELNSEFKAHYTKEAEREEPDKLDGFKDDRNATELGEDKKAITKPPDAPITGWTLPTLKTDSGVPGHKTGARAAVDDLLVPHNLDQDLDWNQHENVKQQDLLIESPQVGKSEAVSSIQPLHSPPVTPDGGLQLDSTDQLPNIGHGVDTVSDKDSDKNAELEEPICETNPENHKSVLVLTLPPPKIEPLSKGEEDSLDSVLEELPSPVQPFREDTVGDVQLPLGHDKQHPVERLETNVLPHEGSTSFISKSEPVAGRISLEKPLNIPTVVGLFPSPQQHGFISELGSDSEQSVNDTLTAQLQSNDCQTENENKQQGNSKQPSVEIESTSHNTSGSSFLFQEGHGVFSSIQCFENDARSSPDLENPATNTTPLPDTHGPAHKSKVIAGTFPRHHRQSDPHSAVIPGPLPFAGTFLRHHRQSDPHSVVVPGPLPFAGTFPRHHRQSDPHSAVIPGPLPFAGTFLRHHRQSDPHSVVVPGPLPFAGTFPRHHRQSDPYSVVVPGPLPFAGTFLRHHRQSDPHSVVVPGPLPFAGTFPRHHRQSDPHSAVIPGPLPFAGTFPRHHRQSDPHSVVVPAGPLPFPWQNHNAEIKDVHTSDGAAPYVS